MAKAKKAIDPRKERLISLSILCKNTRGINPNVFVLQTYSAETGATVWKTFFQWKKDGYKVIKGAKGFPIWSKPIKAKTGKETQAEPQTDSKTDKKEFSFFGICYLFNDLQVEKI